MQQIKRAFLQLVYLVLASTAMLARAQAGSEWQTPAAELARQIASIAGPGVVSLTVRTLSSIPAEEVPRIQQVLTKELTADGITVRSSGDTVTVIRVTLSQTARQGLWVAEVQQGPEVRVAMVSVAVAAPSSKPRDAMLSLRKILLVSQSQPILDAQWIANGVDEARLVVLSPDAIDVYHHTGAAAGAMTKDQSLAIQHSRPFPRDVRGRLESSPGGLFRAYLPGVICTAAQQNSVGSNGLTLACAESDDPWPVGSRKAFYNASRNYFTGIMVPAQAGEPQAFYSTAEVSQRRGGATVLSLVSGSFRVVDAGVSRPLNGARDWGSDIVALLSGCGSGAQLLVSAAGDAAQDSLLAYEMDRTEAVPASAPMPLDGQVTTMWPSVAAGDTAAVVVIKTQQPHSYEAYSVSASCN